MAILPNYVVYAVLASGGTTAVLSDHVLPAQEIRAVSLSPKLVRLRSRR